MLNGKFFLTLIGSLLAIAAICKSDMVNPIVENWWNGIQLSTTANPVIVDSQGTARALGGNYFNPRSMKGRFISNPQFQAMLSPRMSGNIQYGSNIRYDLPDRKNMGVPENPLTFSKMVKENYSDSEPGLSCSQRAQAVDTDYALPAGYKNGNYNDVYNTLTNDGQPAPVISSPCTDTYDTLLPIGTMTATDSTGNEEQVVVVNNLHTVNMKSRKVQGADFIRGDLAITPCQTGWFSVYPTINTDLRAGAMQVLNGDGESNAKLMDLLVSSTGGARSAFGGADLRDRNVNLSNNMRSFLSQGQNTVEVSSFP